METDRIGTVEPEPEPEPEPESLAAEPESRPPLPVDGTGEIDPGKKANGEKEETEGRPNARRRRASTELREHLAASLRRQVISSHAALTLTGFFLVKLHGCVWAAAG